MLEPPELANALCGAFGANAASRAAWARERLGVAAGLPYLPERAPFGVGGVWQARALGGVRLAELDGGLQREAAQSLGAFDGVSVRDRATQAALAALGVSARLEADPVTRLLEHFGARIAGRRRHGPAALLARACPRGYVAVQFAAQYGDDANIARIAANAAAAARQAGVRDVVFFRAGLAPWHDDVAPYRHCAQCVEGLAVQIFDAADVWDICALIAGSRACCTTSLHVTIVARGCGLPVLLLDGGTDAKLAAWADAWG